MKQWTAKELEAENYTIENARISDVSLNMREKGVFTLNLLLEGDGWGVLFGQYVLGKGYLGAKEFQGSAAGMEAIMRVMDTIGVDALENAVGQYVRVTTKGVGEPVDFIGNIIQDKWFSYREFFAGRVAETDAEGETE